MQMGDTQDMDDVTFVYLGTDACGVAVTVNEQRMNLFLVHSIVKWTNFLKQNN